MPQMAPINWLLLFIIFLFTIIIFNILNYFLFMPFYSKMIKIKMKYNSPMNWKW